LVHADEDAGLPSRSELLADIAMTMGGRAAEEVIFGDSEVTAGASADIESATQTARAMVTQLGMSSVGNFALESNRDYSEDMAAKIDRQIRDLVKSEHQKAVGIIRKYRDLVDLLTDMLLDRETIDGEEFRQIVDRETGKNEIVLNKPSLVAGA
jgi:cell division protease FtsH